MRLERLPLCKATLSSSQELQSVHESRPNIRQPMGMKPGVARECKSSAAANWNREFQGKTLDCENVPRRRLEE